MRIQRSDGTVTFEAMPLARVPQRERQLQAEYLRAARRHKATRPDEPLPPRPVLRVWRTVMAGPEAPGLAEAIARELRRKEEAARKTKTRPGH